MNPFRLIVLLEVIAYATLFSQAGFVQLCGEDLLDALKSVCGPRGFYSPPQGSSRRTPATKDGIATRCCDSSCDVSVLEEYCSKPLTTESQIAVAPPRTTSSENERKTNEVVIAGPERAGGNGSQAPRVGGGASAHQESGRNKSKSTPTEIDEEEHGHRGNAGERKDDRSPSVRPESLTDEEGTSPRGKPTNKPNRSREGGRNRTSKGQDRRTNNHNRRRGSGERRTQINAKRLAKQRKKDQQRNQKRQSNSRRRSKLDKKVAAGEKTATTPFAVETAQHPLKNGGYNSTSGDLSLVNVTDTASASETKKDGFFTTITAVLRDVIGFQQADDGNR